ncbi:MAG TPA: hypothetical protein VKB48_15855 [Candidatus Acidoferrum sp.]|nr:hypothetical protein [Candidatus Acidoferrum sp.]
MYRLCLGFMRMTERNAPRAGYALRRYGLTYLPEAHCYLRTGKKRIDLTRSSGDRAEPKTAFVQDEQIVPEQIPHYKISMRKNFLQKWRAHTAGVRGLSLAEV